MRFSIVIPCYKSEEFIHNAIESIENQTFRDYEVLLMCEKDDYPTHEAIRDMGYETIIGDYGSSGQARNVGIDKAKGEYVLFLDSDDRYLFPEALELLDDWLRRTRADVFSFGFIYGKLGFAPVHGNNAYMFPNVWSRAWKRESIGETRFPNTSRDEDVAFVTAMFNKEITHNYVDCPLIYYTYPREGSRMQEKIKENGC